MCMLQFRLLFDTIENHDYVAIKLSPSFPKYTPGEDIDIFCRDIESFSRKVIAFLSQYVVDDFSIKVHKLHNKFHIDLIDKSSIHFRFDLIGEQPQYKNIRIKKSFFDVVIEGAHKKNISGFEVKVPSDVDECILRYIEYIEWFEQRPDKIKHINYINTLINVNVLDANKIFERLYYFTSIPEKEYRPKTFFEKISEHYEFVIDVVKNSLSLIKKDGFLIFLSKVVKRFK